MRIYVKPRAYFLNMSIQDRIQLLKDNFVISINTPVIHSITGKILLEKEESPFANISSKNLLILYFHDLEKKYFKDDVLFNENDVKQIETFVEYIKQHNTINTIYVHCTAGISRSGAVGYFLNTYFNIFLQDNKKDNNAFWKDNYEIIPNSLVKSLLFKHYQLY